MDIESIKKAFDQVMRRIYHRLFLMPRGYGNPVPVQDWEAQYLRGEWQFLESMDVMAHYMVIVGYIYHVGKGSGDSSLSLLDVGCGQGQLLRYLNSAHFGSYLGIDISSEAIRIGQSLSLEKAHLLVADFENWEGKEQFDIIIFNESLIYANNPLKTLLYYESYLKEKGFFIVSMHQSLNADIIINNIRRHFSVTSSVEVRNAKLQTWTIQLIPRRKFPVAC